LSILLRDTGDLKTYVEPSRLGLISPRRAAI
jgi:hypothetical protein